MAQLEKLYTVEEIANMTSLTTRTIRNYLRDGTLKGRKIGGQWRFTSGDVGKFMDSGDLRSTLENEMKQSVVDFIDGVNTDIKSSIQICTIIDLYTSQDKAKQTSDRICELMNTSKGESYLSYKYDYIEPEEKARYILFASPDFLINALNILK